jgi:DNA-directed RNA polymerase sigma subunit (sigma70/sigma32)
MNRDEYFFDLVPRMGQEYEYEPTSEELLENGVEEAGDDQIDFGEASEPQRDLLLKYIRDVNKFSLLTPDEEKKLTRQLHETSDLDVRARLVTSNLRLVTQRLPPTRR